MIYRKWWCSIAICNKWLQGSTGFSQCTLHFYQTLCWSSMHRVLIHPHHAQTIHSPCVSTWVCEPASAVKSQAVEDSSNKKLAGNDWRIQPMVQWLWVSLKIGVPQTIGSPKFARGQGSTRIHRFGWSLSNWVCYDASDLATLPSPQKKVVSPRVWQQPVNIWNNPSGPQEPPEPPGSKDLRLAIPLVVASPNKPRFDLVLSGSMIVGDTLSLTKWH